MKVMFQCIPFQCIHKELSILLKPMFQCIPKEISIHMNVMFQCIPFQCIHKELSILLKICIFLLPSSWESCYNLEHFTPLTDI